MVPNWLHILSIAMVALGLACASIIAWDETRHPQYMWIMNIVWPVCALFGTVFWLWGYFRFGRLRSYVRVAAAQREERDPPTMPFAVTVGVGASHCGSGCMLGDILAEVLVVIFPGIPVLLGWQWIFPERIFAIWVLDYIVAYLVGIVFQYFAIAPMRNLHVSEGLWAAVKADTLSLTAWQVGMYGAMAIAHFWIFAGLLGQPLRTDSVEFWFAMQLAMLCGFATSYPVNWWLIRSGIKEAM